MSTQTTYKRTGITDTNEYELPDVSGGADAFGEEKVKTVGVYITNGGDQPLTARLERATFGDESMSNPVVDTGGVPVPSNDTSVIGANQTIPMAEFRVVVSFDSAPTDATVTAEFQVGERWR